MFPAGLPKLNLSTIAGENRLNGFKQCLMVEGLLQCGGRSEMFCDREALLADPAHSSRYRNDLQLRMCHADLADRLDSIFLRHEKVCYHQAEIMGWEQFERLDAIFRRLNGEPLGHQHHPEDLTRAFVVIDYQDIHLNRRLVCRMICDGCHWVDSWL